MKDQWIGMVVLNIGILILLLYCSVYNCSDLILQQEVGKARLLMVELQIVDKARQGGGSSRGRTWTLHTMVTKAVIKDTEAAIKDLEVETASPSGVVKIWSLSRERWRISVFSSGPPPRWRRSLRSKTVTRTSGPGTSSSTTTPAWIWTFPAQWTRPIPSLYDLILIGDASTETKFIHS